MCSSIARTDLQYADLSSCVFYDDVQEIPIVRSRNYALAVLPDRYLLRLGLSVEHNTNLAKRCLRSYSFEGMDLQVADFSNVDLYSAKFDRADIRGAIFSGAIVQKADFRGAIGFSIHQLRAARSWKMTFFDKKYFSEAGVGVEHNKGVDINDYHGYESESPSECRGLTWRAMVHHCGHSRATAIREARTLGR